MTRPWIAIVAGVCGLFVITIGLRQFRSQSPTTAVSQKQLASLLDKTNTERGGWIARPDTGGSQESGGVAGGHGFASGGVGANGAGGAQGGTQGGAGAIVQGSGGARGSFGYAAGSGPGSGSVEVNAAVPALAAPFEGAKLGQSTKEGGALGSSASGNGKDPSKDTTDKNGLVLSLPFSDSTLPDKGDTAPVVEQGVTCGADGCKFSTDSQFAIPDAGNLNGQEGTVSFCLQPDWNGSDPGDASLMQLRNANVWENRLQIFKNGRYMRLILTPNTGLEAGASSDIINWQSGQRHAIAATWGQDPNSGQSMVTFYVDGQMVGSPQPYDGQLEIPPGTALNIGSDIPQGGPGAGGTLSSFQGYNQPLNVQSIAGLAAGCAPQ